MEIKRELVVNLHFIRKRKTIQGDREVTEHFLFNISSRIFNLLM